MSDWTALPSELLECITNRLTLIEDLNAFRGVCVSWRAVDHVNFVSKVPLVMLAEIKGSNEREFYSLSKRRVCMRMPLPDTTGKRCLNAGFGWIFTAALSGEVCLLKPFSGARIELPNIKTSAFYYLKGALLTADPSKTSNFKVIIAGIPFFGYWSNAGENWMMMDMESLDLGIFMVYLKELVKLYTLDGLSDTHWMVFQRLTCRFEELISTYLKGE